MFRRLLLCLTLGCGVGLAVTGCGDGGKGAAEAAIDSARTSFEALKKDAAMYAPDQAKGVEAALAAAQDLAMKGDYRQALTEATGIPPKIVALTEATTAKKTALMASWTQMNADLPKDIEAIQNRVAMLSKSRRLPKGVTREGLGSAKSGLDALTMGWTEATKEFATGNVAEAVSKAESVRSKAGETMTALGMKMPAPPK